jgi:PAS domain S-box-containing protein
MSDHVLLNSEITTRDQEDLRRLQLLSRATKEIMSKLESTTLNSLLPLIASHTAELVDAETCRIYLVKREGFLSREAYYESSEGQVQRQKEVAIRRGSGTGLLGHIAFDGKLFNASGTALRNHIAACDIRSGDRSELNSYSMLAVPLKKREGQAEKLIGLVCAENKRAEGGRELETTGFTIDDEWVLTTFAEQVVVAIEITKMVGELSERKDHLDRLIDSSPNGVIAIDASGNVSGFNKRAEEVLGYTADELMGTSIAPLYDNPREARKTARLLHLTPDGKLEKYETSLRTKSGQVIPVRASAAWLYDSNRNRIGGVGYFEDLRSIREAERRVELLLEAGNTVANPGSLTDGLRSLAKMMADLLPHSFCRILLLDENEDFLVVRAAYPIPRTGEELNWRSGLDQKMALSDWENLRDLLYRGKPVVLGFGDERTRPALIRLSRHLGLEKDIQSLLVVPLKIGNRVAGLLEMGELRNEGRRQFAPAEVDLASAIAAQVTVLIDRMLTRERREEHDHSHLVAQTLSGAYDLKQLLHMIVESSQSLLSGESSTIWPYDKGLDRFIPEELVTVGMSEEEEHAFREIDPPKEGITFTVLREGWIGVSDILTSDYEFLKSERVELLKRMGVRSFQGVALRVVDETVGVLYVNYKRPRSFGDEDRHAMENLATSAALFLERIRLKEQVGKAKAAAEVVAQVSALSERAQTLTSLTQGTRDAVGCDAVTLYVYNQAIDKCDHPPTMVGVTHPEKLLLREPAPNSIVYKMLQLDAPYFVDRVSEDLHFQGSRFARDEKIKSCVTVALKVAAQRVGVMFLSYRTRHHFTRDELTNLELFANQAALAIHNALVLEESNRKLREQEALVEFSRKLFGTFTTPKILDLAAVHSKDLLGADMANIVLPDKQGDLIFVAAAGWHGVEVDVTRMETGIGSQTGFTILNAILNKPGVVVDDYAEEKRFIVPDIVFENNIVSGVSVPMFRDEEVVGAMLLHTTTLRHFTEAEVKTLSLIATQTASAIKIAEQIEAINKQSAYLKALHEASKAITRSFPQERTEILGQIVQQAVECVIGSQEDRHGFGTIQLYDAKTSELVFENYYSLRMSPDLLARKEGRRSLNANPRGITGRTVATRKPQRVRDVRDDPDYIEFDSRTKSELDVPLLEQGEVLGVLSLESDLVDAFGEDDEKNLLALAELAVTAIKNADLYRQLKQEKGLVGTRTALAWMGMASTAWGHSVRGYAINIRELTRLLRREMGRANFIPRKARNLIKERLAEIESGATRILEKPITAPLSIEEGVWPVPINNLIKERVAQLWENDAYKPVSKHLNLDDEGPTTVLCNSDWVRRALDILIDNAVQATANSPARSITISTHIVSGKVEIAVADTGPGIAGDVLDKILKEPIKKSQGSRGSGIGLLMAQVIVQTYGGEILVASSAEGTKMVIRLPLEESKE